MGFPLIVKGFTALEQILARCSGQYCVGDQVTLADCFLVPQVYNATRFHVDMQSFANIARVSENLKGLEPFRKAHMNAQPDTPSELAA